MTGEARVFLGIGLATLVILVGGIFFLSNQPGQSSSQPADSEVLIKEDSYKIGSESAKVKIVEFGDFQCPACGAAHPVVKQIASEYENDVQFVFRHFPLAQHQNARLAAEAAEAAGEQGKFWEMHDLLFENQTGWESIGDNEARDLFIEFAKDLELDTEKFSSALDSEKFADKIERDVSDGYSVGVNSTPTFFINGEQLRNWGYEQFKQRIDLNLEGK